METQHKSVELMRAYLLGVLPDDEATALEEEYFVDRQSFHRLQTEEASLITDYLDGRLPKEQRNVFEGRYLRVPDLVDKVEEFRQQRKDRHPAVWLALWRRLGFAVTVFVLLVGLGIWVRHFVRKQPNVSSQSQPIKEKSPEPLQKNSSALEQRTKRPQVAPVTPIKKRSLARVTPHNTRDAPPAHSFENLAKPGAQGSLSKNAPAVETAAVNKSPRRLGFLPSTTAYRKKRVAVLDFDYGTVQPYVFGIYGSNQDVGRGITDLLVQKVIQDGEYSVIERKAVDKILAEQNFSNSDRANPAMAAKIGKLLGVDAVIVGSITKFGRDDKSKSYGGLGVGPRAFGIGGIKKSEAKAVCAISVRLVDTSTGEVLAAVTGEGESKRSGTSLIGGAGSNDGGVGGFDTHASNFGQTLLGEAVMQAVTDVGGQLGESVANVPTRKGEVSGMVADVSGNTLIVNLGSKTGLKVGDKLDISRADRQIKDPTTGKALETVTNKIGEGTIVEIDADSATLTFSGTSAAKVGDVAKIPN
jgi:curli biogenesis system outer membrane secretion channel CsgG